MKQVKGIKEYSYHDEHRVTYGIAESRYCTPETNLTLTLTRLELKFLKKEPVTKDHILYDSIYMKRPE